MQNDHTQPPNITRKTRICYVQLATIRTFQKVSISKTYQIFKQRIMTTYRLPTAIEHGLPKWPLVDFRKKLSGKVNENFTNNAHSILALGGNYYWGLYSLL